jgi:hypothetical protein
MMETPFWLAAERKALRLRLVIVDFVIEKAGEQRGSILNHTLLIYDARLALEVLLA